MQMSLRCRRTVVAVMSSVGIVVGILPPPSAPADTRCSTPCARRAGINLVLGSFSPFTVLTVLIDPYSFGGNAFDSANESDVIAARFTVFFFSWAATAAYAAIVWAMYRSMVRNFDMTIPPPVALSTPI